MKIELTTQNIRITTGYGDMTVAYKGVPYLEEDIDGDYLCLSTRFEDVYLHFEKRKVSLYSVKQNGEGSFFSALNITADVTVTGEPGTEQIKEVLDQFYMKETKPSFYYTMYKQPASNLNDAKRDILEKRTDEILITLHGKPVMVLMSYEEYQKLKDDKK